MKIKAKNNSKLTKLTTWENEPKIQDLKNDLEASSSFHEDYKAKLLQYEEDREGGKKINARPGKSTARPKVVRKNAEWKYPKLEDPFLNTEDMFEIRPRTWEDANAAEQNQLLLNYQWSTKIDKVRLVNDIVRYLVDDGTVIVKTGWEVQEKTIKVMQEEPVYAGPEESLIMMEELVNTGQMSPEEAQEKMMNGEPMQIGVREVEVEVTKIVKNQPKYEVCNTANVIIDPTCEGYIEDANFIIHEYDTNIAELKNEEYYKDPETGEVSGVYHNLDRIKDEDGASVYDEHKSDAYNEFKFTDKARKKLTAYEYWGYWDINGDETLVPIVATWVGEVLIRLEENPFPHKRLPFSIATYMPIKKEVMGEPDAELLRENQESIGKLTRAAHDITSEQAVGQEFIDETLFPNIATRQQYEKGNTVYYRAGMDPKRAIYKKDIAPVPSSVFNMIQWQQADAESLTGTKAFNGGISGNALGDMLDINTDIPLINGKFKRMGDIEVGDELIGLNGKGTKVKELFDIAYPKRAFDLTFANGAVIKAGVEHKWTIKVEGIERKYRKWHTVDTGRLEELMKLAETKPALKVYVPRVKRVDMNGEIPDIDAYTVGAWLGDGGSWHPTITSEDEGILNNIRKVYDFVEGASQVEGSNAKTYYIVSKNKDSKHERNDKGQFASDEDSFENKLIKFGLHKRYGGEKHIPEAFFSAPYEVKMDLIRGLMDTDGYAHSGAFNTFCQTEGRLKDDFIRLLKSIGITPKISKCLTAEEANRRKAKYKSGLDVTAKTTMYEIGFTCEDNPFSLERKAKKYKAPKSSNTYRIKSVVEVDKVLMRCLAVDSEDHLFAAGDTMIMTHNSVGGVRSALDATSQRELSILRRLSNLFKDMARLTIAMNQAYLSEEEVVRVTNEEFVTIRRDELLGEFDLKIDVSTPEKDEDTATKLNMLLQTNAASMDPAEARIYRAKIAKLWKQPDLAKAIESYQPQPDPIQEELKLLALEEAKLKIILARKELEEMDSRIVERVSRSEENKFDRVTKEAQAKERMAKAEEALARAEYTREQTDALANEFVKDVTGQKRAEYELDKEFDAAVKMAQKASSKVASGKMSKIIGGSNG